MKVASSIFCAGFCILLTVSADPEPDFERYIISATLVPLSKNENVFISPNTSKAATYITDNNTLIEYDGQNSTGILVPKVFPNGEADGVKIKNFDENLLHKEDNSSSTTHNSPTDTEVKDLLRVNNNTSPSPLISPKSKVVPDKANEEAELIENGENTEDLRILNHQHASKLEEINKIATDPLGHGSIFAIFVGALTLVVVLCYVGMLSWRKYLERKYGSRQILVNEDDFALEDPNDLRHFSI